MLGRPVLQAEHASMLEDSNLPSLIASSTAFPSWAPPFTDGFSEKLRLTCPSLHPHQVNHPPDCLNFTCVMSDIAGMSCPSGTFKAVP